METWIVADAATLAARAGDWVVQVARESIAARGRFAWVLAGGSSPQAMHEWLAAPERREQIDWSRVRVFFGDERAVAPTDPKSNCGAALRSMLEHVPVDPLRVYRMEAERDDRAVAAAEYAETLAANVDVDPATRMPVFDLLTIGVGNDGHVLSLHPGCAQIDAPTGAVAALRNVPMDPPLDRLTLTPPVVRVARNVLVIAHGAGKANAIRPLRAGIVDPSNVASRVLAGCVGRVVLVCDESAASAPLEPATAGDPQR